MVSVRRAILHPNPPPPHTYVVKKYLGIIKVYLNFMKLSNKYNIIMQAKNLNVVYDILPITINLENYYHAR